MLARGALRFLHFRQIAACFVRGVPAVASAQAGDFSVIQRHINAATKRLPWESKCFERALAAKLMLRRRNMNGKLYLGVKKEGKKFVAHAWLEHEEAEDYVVLARF